jgi:hypothetical protein
MWEYLWGMTIAQIELMSRQTFDTIWKENKTYPDEEELGRSTETLG